MIVLESIIAIIFALGIWFFIGYLVIVCIDTLLYEEYNPLWNIPLLILGPFGFVVFLAMAIVQIIKNYIEEVRDYYRRKDEKKGRVKYEEDFSSNRHAERFHRWAAWNSRGRSNRR